MWGEKNHRIKQFMRKGIYLAMDHEKGTTT